MKAKVLDISGKKTKEIELPSIFSRKIRKDLIAKVLESKKSKQPYSPSLVAGKQHAASGKMVHRRHVWRSGYGRGQSRIPRKITSRRGTQFTFIGAEVSSTRGGRRAHPPKILSMINTKKMNKKELKNALIYAINATFDKNVVAQRYERLNGKNLENLPLLVESKLTGLRTKEFISSLKKILGKDIFEIALKKKTVRSGKGKFRGRKYKRSAGILLVIGKEEKLKVNSFDSKNAGNLGVSDLAEGGIGRITLYTEQAIKDLGEKLK